MRQVQLNDQLFDEAEQMAAAAGFKNVDDYVADILRHSLQAQSEDLDDLFTPERLAKIDAAAEEIKAGEFLTAEQVDDHFRRKLSNWPQTN